MDDDEFLDALQDDESANEPERLPLPGCTGPRDLLTDDDKRRRREAMSALLTAGASTDEIVAAFGLDTLPDGRPGFAMSRSSVHLLMREVWASWDEEDAERKGHYKGASIRRIQSHIRKAAREKAFGPVAMLEKQLAEIQGTNEPRHVRVEGDMRLSAAVLSVLGETDPTEVRRMIAEEGKRAQLGIGGDAEIVALPPDRGAV